MHENVKVESTTSPEQIAEMTKQIPEMPHNYYNYARAAGSFFEIRLFFGQSSVTPQGQQTFQEQLCVVMSPEFAKLLRDNLSISLDAYQEKFGILRKVPTQPDSSSVTDSTTPEPNGGKKKRK